MTAVEGRAGFGQAGFEAVARVERVEVSISARAGAPSASPCGPSPCSAASCGASACGAAACGGACRAPSADAGQSACGAARGSATPGADRIICRCLQVTESSILEAIASCPIRTLRDLCRLTQAGEGCMACRRELHRYVEIAAATWGGGRAP